MDDDVPLTDIVRAARAGDLEAWHEMVRRYSPLVHAVAHRCHMRGDDAADVAQTVWLRLVEHLGAIRDPQALPLWIATTSRRECLRVARLRARVRCVDPLAGPVADWPHPTSGDLDAELLHAERQDAARAGVAGLPERQRDLLLLLAADPPVSYGEISRRLAIPIGSIGPTRARALRHVRRSPAVAALLDGAAPPAAAVDKRPLVRTLGSGPARSTTARARLDGERSSARLPRARSTAAGGEPRGR